jgi:hypothetical protein
LSITIEKQKVLKIETKHLIKRKSKVFSRGLFREIYFSLGGNYISCPFSVPRFESTFMLISAVWAIPEPFVGGDEQVFAILIMTID